VERVDRLDLLNYTDGLGMGLVITLLETLQLLQKTVTSSFLQWRRSESTSHGVRDFNCYRKQSQVHFYNGGLDGIHQEAPLSIRHSSTPNYHQTQHVHTDTLSTWKDASGDKGDDHPSFVRLRCEYVHAVLSEQGEGWDIMERSMMLCV
jgi:hypothetical protein